MSLIKRSEPREIQFLKNDNPYAEGSIIACFGNTKVHITATVEEEVPRWMKGTGKGWVTCLLYTSPSPRDRTRSRMPSSA